MPRRAAFHSIRDIRSFAPSPLLTLIKCVPNPDPLQETVNLVFQQPLQKRIGYLQLSPVARISLAASHIPQFRIQLCLRLLAPARILSHRFSSAPRQNGLIRFPSSDPSPVRQPVTHVLHVPSTGLFPYKGRLLHRRPKQYLSRPPRMYLRMTSWLYHSPVDITASRKAPVSGIPNTETSSFTHSQQDDPLSYTGFHDNDNCKIIQKYACVKCFFQIS